MNKTLLLTILVFISLAFLANFASAKSKIADSCKCKPRAVVKCGFSRSDEAKKCRLVYAKKCQTRCNLLLKCSDKIASKCVTFTKGTLEYKKCERSTSSKYCVSLLKKKEELFNCKCKSFAKAVCGTCPSPTAVNCRDDAYEACKKQCGNKLACKSKKRICITPKGCSCKSIAKKKCSVEKDFGACFKTQYDTCNKRCLASSRCYPVTCKNAGSKRCAKAVAVVCKKFSADLKQYEQCVEKKTDRCLSYEAATCKKARRLFKYRTECDYSAKVRCEGLSEEKKCTCIQEVREKCLKEKKDLRKKYLRHCGACRKRAKLLCDAKESCKDLRACYIEETKHCVRRQKRREHIVPPECVDRVAEFCGSKEGECFKKNLAECTEKWLCRYCERKSFKACDGDLDCMKKEITKCKQRLPKCWENRDLCNDNNKCTNDVCDPEVGCLHVTKTCDDNNPCTKDVCDPKEGCVHTEIKCDDGIDCTKDSCKKGQCVHEYVHTKCTSTDKCTVGFCTNNGCKFEKDKSKECDTDVKKICEQCKAKNKCEKVVKCEILENLTPKCTIERKTCDDKKSCTKDSCDIETGKCVHTKIQSKECEPPICKDLIDCAAWAKEKQLTKNCQVPVCSSDKGVCDAVDADNKDCVKVPDCVEHCKPRDACEGPTTSCTRDKVGKIICNRPPYPCDDGSKCTKDACNINTGVCTHVFERNGKDCLEECETDEFCIQWALRSGLDKKCKTARCNKPNKSCEIIDQLDKSKCPIPDGGCKNCVPRNACETDVKCVIDAEGQPACVRVTKKCDDRNPCTLDTCDTETGKCVHVFNENKLCKKCKVQKDCEAWGSSLKLKSICKTAVCDETTNRCKAVKLSKEKCDCPLDCKPANACEIARCSVDKDGKTFCARIAKSCDDKNPCTVDSCDTKTGKCVHTKTECYCEFDSHCSDYAKQHKLAEKCREAYCTAGGICEQRLSSDQSKCSEVPVCIDCVPLNKCDSVKCIIEKGVPKCIHTLTKCNDGNKCTRDYCDVTTGQCVYQKLDADECKICKVDKDCDQYAKEKDLASSCQEAYCEDNICKVRTSKDQSRCVNIPLCYNCVATACEEKTECVFGNDKKPVCIRTEKKCNDNNQCTVDACDEKTGDCVHTFYKTSQCEPCVKDPDCTDYAKKNNLESQCKVAVCNKEKGYCVEQKAPDTSKCVTPKCKITDDCKAWAASNKLADDCKEAVCDTKTNLCVSRPMEDLSKCTKCKEQCVAKNCEIATCSWSEAGFFFCDRRVNDCNDNDECTADSCDIKTGKCKNKRITDGECKCTTDACCKENGKKKVNNCEEYYYDTTAKSCKIRIKDKTCVPDDYCKQACPAKDLCHKSKCHYDSNNKIVCDEQPLKECNDKKDCTKDSCDPKRGCQHEFITSEKCVKCTKDVECATVYATQNQLAVNCREPFCNANGECDSRVVKDKTCVTQEECKKKCGTNEKCKSYGCVRDEKDQIQCNYVVKTCNDNIECTKDYCDEKTGICVHENKCGPECRTPVNCVQWASEQKLSQQCKEAFCNNGYCDKRDLADVTKCPVECDKVCPKAKECETVACAYDKNKKVNCVYNKIKGCQVCKADTDCDALTKASGDKCSKFVCENNKCVKKPVANPECLVCPPTCSSSSLCEVAALVKTETSCTCEITPIKCDDGKDCTTDYCDAKTGQCRNIFKYSDKCTSPCVVDAQCIKYAIDNKLSDNCKVAVCDVKLGACVAKDDTKTNCKKCQLDCKPSSNCESAYCDWDGLKYVCKRESKTCDDQKKCTKDSCDAKTGQCKHDYICDTEICTKDLDCAAWGLANGLKAKCLKPVCNTKDATCQSVADPECKTVCKKNSDCPPTKHGSVCDTTTNTCVENECQYDVDCLGNAVKPGDWSYCKPRPYTGQKVCECPYGDKGKTCKGCVKNSDCDDKDPCTKDVCLPEYGYCRNIKKCDDNNECTIDTATPNPDGTCTCTNAPRPCTVDQSLLVKPFVSLTSAEKPIWLGKCEKNRGCITCVVSAQCDDNNGCTKDECLNQVCQNNYVTYFNDDPNKKDFNIWCDPKLASQPIYFQSIPGLRDKLALAGYDINKLAN